MSMLHTSLVFAATATTLALGANVPSATSKPLSEVLVALESGGLKSVTEVSFDDGRWEVEGVRDGKPVELEVDSETSKIISERADAGRPELPAEAKSFAVICKQLEEAGYGPISEAELDSTGWEIETLHKGVPRKLVVELGTGKIVSDQPDE